MKWNIANHSFFSTAKTTTFPVLKITLRSVLLPQLFSKDSNVCKFMPFMPNGKLIRWEDRQKNVNSGIPSKFVNNHSKIVSFELSIKRILTASSKDIYISFDYMHHFITTIKRKPKQSLKPLISLRELDTFNELLSWGNVIDYKSWP